MTNVCTSLHRAFIIMNEWDMLKVWLIVPQWDENHRMQKSFLTTYERKFCWWAE